MTPQAYGSISSDLTLILPQFTQAVGGATDPRVNYMFRALSGIANWAKLPADKEKWDRQTLELVRANSNYSSTWLLSALSELAYDLLQQAGTDKLEEAEKLAREGVANGLAKLADPDTSDKVHVRAYVGSLYLLLAHILLCENETEKAHAEILNLLAFYDKVAADWGPLNGVIDLQEAHHLLLQIAALYSANGPDGYDKAVAAAREANAVELRMINQAPSFMPNWLKDLLNLADGHEHVVKTALDANGSGTSGLTENEYKSISFDLGLVLQAFVEAVGSPTDARLNLLLRAIASVANWAKLPAEKEKCDRQYVAVMRANPDYSSTLLIDALSQLAGDLYQQGGNDRLAEAEALVREALVIGLAESADPDTFEVDQVRGYVGSLYLQLARILIAQNEKDRAGAEIVNFLTFFDKLTEDDLGVVNGVIHFQDAHRILLQIAKLYLAEENGYDKAVAIAREANAVELRMINRAPNVIPTFLSDLLDLADGHEHVYETFAANGAGAAAK